MASLLKTLFGGGGPTRAEQLDSAVDSMTQGEVLDNPTLGNPLGKKKKKKKPLTTSSLTMRTLRG